MSCALDYVVTIVSLAGSATSNSWADGTYSAASFSTWNFLAVDTAGNVFVSEQANNRVRKITSLGVVTTLAGSGLAGSTDGYGTAAKFYNPKGVGVNSNGDCYVADFYNNKIRVISSGGAVTTFVGTGIAGLVDGTGKAASLSYPIDIAMDTVGNIYTLDTNQYSRIRKITPLGMTTALAGSPTTTGYKDGTGTNALFSVASYGGLTVDAIGNVFVAEYGNQKIRKITSLGVVTTFAGAVAGNNDGVGTSANFNGPISVTVDVSGNLYVADWNNQLMRIVTPSAVVTTYVGPNTPGYIDSTETRMYYSSVRVDSSMNVYMGEYFTFRIRKVSLSGRHINFLVYCETLNKQLMCVRIYSKFQGHAAKDRSS